MGATPSKIEPRLAVGLRMYTYNLFRDDLSDQHPPRAFPRLYVDRSLDNLAPVYYRLDCSNEMWNKWQTFDISDAIRNMTFEPPWTEISVLPAHMCDADPEPGWVPLQYEYMFYEGTKIKLDGEEKNVYEDCRKMPRYTGDWKQKIDYHLCEWFYPLPEGYVEPDLPPGYHERPPPEQEEEEEGKEKIAQ